MPFIPKNSNKAVIFDYTKHCYGNSYHNIFSYISLIINGELLNMDRDNRSYHY